MKAKLLIAAGVIVAAALAFAIYQWNIGHQRDAIARQAVPDMPSLSAQPTELAQRIQKADANVREGSDPLESLSELSRLYHANGFLNEAWHCYHGLLQADPKNPLWPYRLASILAGYGELEEAAPLYRQSLSLDPSYLPVHIRLGDTLLKMNRFAEAEAVYEGALKREPKNAYALVGKARIAIANENWPEARSLLETAISATSFKIGADLLGDVYEKLGMKSKEQIVLKNMQWGSYADIPDKRMLSLMDDSYDAYQVSIAGGWVLHQGDTDTGLRYLKRALKLDPNGSMLHYQIAAVYRQIGDLEKSREHYERSVELDPQLSDGWIALINIAKETASATAARRLLEQAYAQNPESPSLNIMKGEGFLEQGNIDQAIHFFKRSIEFRPNEASGYIALARAYLTQERVPEGLELMREALKNEPSNPVALTSLAFGAIMQGDQKAADEWFKRLSIQPRLTEKEIDALVQRYHQQFGEWPPKQ